MQKLFDDSQLVSRRAARRVRPPPFEDTGFRVPEGPIPNLEFAPILGIDTETYDPRFDDYGPGWARNDGFIAGVSLATHTDAWYFPVGHTFDPSENIQQPDAFWNWLRWLLNENPVPVCGANLTYDFGWLHTKGVKPRGQIHDVQYAEALLDTFAEVALEILGWKYCHKGKETNALYDWIRKAYPNTPETKLRKEIYRSPVNLAGFYACEDARLPLQVLDKQLPLLVRDEVDYVYRLECDLIPMMTAMRARGVLVNLEYAHELKKILAAQIIELYNEINEVFGWRLADTDSRRLGPFFDYLGIDVPRTAEGNYSVQKEWLKALEHPAGEKVLAIRQKEKLIGTFINGHIIGANVNGRVFPQFPQLRSDDGGTKVGRFASQTPNLQQIPARTKEGKLIRDAFTKDFDTECWVKFDYSQVHYRILAHYAVGPGSDELRHRYNSDRKTDYHRDVYNNVAPLMGWSLTDEEEIELYRRPVKNVNFGLLYGQSEKRLAYTTGFSGAQAEQFFKAYFQGAPYVKPTMKATENEMMAQGYITTILGRRTYFNEWEPAEYGVRGIPCSYEQARLKWGNNIRLAYGYRAINYRFQGSEPDIMKSGMRALWNSGVLEYTGVPHVTVHDELGFSRRDSSPIVMQAFEYAQHTLENTIKLRVPLFVDRSEGPTWGKAK